MALVFLPFHTFSQTNYLNKPISMSADSISIDQVFDVLSKTCSCYFTYNANTIDGNKIVSLNVNGAKLHSVLDTVLLNNKFYYTEYRNQVVISMDSVNRKAVIKTDSNIFVEVSGRVVDKQSGEPLAFASVAIQGAFLGTICNELGYFSLRIPTKYSNDTLLFSYVGYYTSKLVIEEQSIASVNVELEPGIVSIQEIVVRKNNPEIILKKALKNIDANYETQAFNYEAFYREGIVSNNEYVLYTEALLEGYKPKLYGSFGSDQVQMVKSRQFSNVNNKDTVAVKVSSGLKSCFRLDVVNSLPDFLQEEGFELYNYTLVDILVWQKSLVYKIDFSQKNHVSEPLPEGSVFISFDDYAIVGVDFNYSQKKIKNNSTYVVRKSRAVKVQPKGSDYYVRYMKYGDKYYLSHVRGKLFMNVKRRKMLFKRDYSILIEMIVTHIKDKDEVQRIAKSKLVKTNTIFSESAYIYERDFWKNNNAIEPEVDIIKAFNKYGLRITEEN